MIVPPESVNVVPLPNQMPPPLMEAVLPEIVPPETVTEPELAMPMPPPFLAVLPVMEPPVIVKLLSAPDRYTPPPTFLEVLPVIDPPASVKLP